MVVIDQSANEGWVSLGEFGFDAGAAHSVVLGDNTGEPIDGEISIVFDAIHLVRRYDDGQLRRRRRRKWLPNPGRQHVWLLVLHGGLFVRRRRAAKTA